MSERPFDLETILRAPAGMRDFPPPVMRVREHLFRAFHEASRRFAFEPYDGPVVEHFDLYHRKAGGEAEELQRQIYDFHSKGDAEEGQVHLALRPEMTPTLARLIVREQQALPRPVRWYAIPQCFRYEKAQRGRRREHFQWNLDIVGQEGVEAEAEVLACVVAALESMGLSEREVAVRFSSRRLLRDVVLAQGVPEDKAMDVFAVVDKRDRLSEAAFRTLLEGCGLAPGVVSDVVSVLGLKDVAEVAGRLGHETPGTREVAALLAILSDCRIEKWFEFDLGIVRGLAYYTGLVFEGFARGTLRESCPRAIFGGGRYDNLLFDLGGEPMTAVGLGFGDVVILDVLEAAGKLPAEIQQGSLDAVVTGAKPEDRRAALRAAATLRSKGLSVLPVVDGGIKKVFKTAERRGAKLIVFASEEGLAMHRQMVRVRDARSREEAEAPLDVVATGGWRDFLEKKGP